MQSINIPDNDSNSHLLDLRNIEYLDIYENESIKFCLPSTGEDRPKSKGRPPKSLVHINGQTVSYCNKCNKLFSNSSALAKHRSTHSEERKYVCSTCNRAFKRPDHLSGHIMTHSDTKPFPCQMENCSKSYCDARSLRRHHNHYHASLLKNPQIDICLEENTINNESTDRILICSECNKKFKNASALNGHMRLHRRNNDPYLNTPVTLNNIKHITSTNMLLPSNMPKNYNCLSNETIFCNISKSSTDVFKSDYLINNLDNASNSSDFLNNMPELNYHHSISNSLTKINNHNFPPIQIQSREAKYFEEDSINYHHRQLNVTTLSETLGNNKALSKNNCKLSDLISKKLNSNMHVDNSIFSFIFNNNNRNGVEGINNVDFINAKSLAHDDTIFSDFSHMKKSDREPSIKDEEPSLKKKKFNNFVMNPTKKALITSQINFEENGLIQNFDEKSSILKQIKKTFKNNKKDNEIEHFTNNNSLINTPININSCNNRGLFKRIERLNRPHPLIIPSLTMTTQLIDDNPQLNSLVLNKCSLVPATPFAFQSKLRSPRIFYNENLSLFTPYTPPPMLSPFRNGSGLYCHLKKNMIPDIIQEEDVEQKEISLIEKEKTPKLIETDISPHINIGEEYQAVIPDINCIPSYDEDIDALLWHPNLLLKVAEDEVNLYLDFSTSLCLAHNGSNKEIAYHLLYIKQGDLTQAIKSLLQEKLKIPINTSICTYKYQESIKWSKKEVDFFTKEIHTNGKDFHLLASKLKEKSTKHCVEFYYTWKKFHSKYNQRIRRLRKKNDAKKL